MAKATRLERFSEIPVGCVISDGVTNFLWKMDDDIFLHLRTLETLDATATELLIRETCGVKFMVTDAAGWDHQVRSMLMETDYAAHARQALDTLMDFHKEVEEHIEKHRETSDLPVNYVDSLPEEFDAVIMSDMDEEVQQTLQSMQALCGPGEKAVVEETETGRAVRVVSDPDASPAESEIFVGDDDHEFW